MPLPKEGSYSYWKREIPYITLYTFLGFFHFTKTLKKWQLSHCVRRQGYPSYYNPCPTWLEYSTNPIFIPDFHNRPYDEYDLRFPE